MKTDVPVNRYPNLTVIWNPLTVGVPDVGGNDFRDYFPGLKYLDTATKPRSGAAYRRFIVPLSG